MPASPVLSGGQNYVGSTVTQTGADIQSPGARGVRLVVNMTAAGTGSITVAIQGKDKQSGQYYAILTGAAITTNSVNIYTVFPGATAAANVTANDFIPEIWRWVATAGNANPATYSVGFSTL